MKPIYPPNPTTKTWNNGPHYPRSTAPQSTSSLHLPPKLASEDEFAKLDEELTRKVSSLRNLSIRIGDELREHNTLLSGMTGTFDRSEGFLRSTMSRPPRFVTPGAHANNPAPRIGVYVLITFILISIVLRVGEWSGARDQTALNRKQHVYYHEGSHNSSEAYFVHLVTAIDLLVRLTPIQADSDLLISADTSYDQLIKYLPPVHRAKCSLKNPLYVFNVSWDEFVEQVGSDVYQLFPYQSSSLGPEQIVLIREQHHDLMMQLPRPVLIVVQPYPDAHENHRFLLEIFPYRSAEPRYRDAQRAAEQGSPTFEELTVRYATVPEGTDYNEGDSTLSQPTDHTGPSQPSTTRSRFSDGVRSLEPIFNTLAEALFDVLL
ncbi:hypothetical protein P879_06447 [Paragonimus westermani]|uniref:t-SNARE coiled-coil homology domain-containing protein n=1 Tax=Paragonimus westermani TaxID=34504 RepID=A0A8T0DJ94_9TREM|nr:hypothetical protein P879_06447 [Paragonimus westermani]